MNIDTGKFHQLTPDELTTTLERGTEMIPIKMADATAKQLADGRVSLKDHNSTLGKMLTKSRRSRYFPHVGKKELAKKGES